MGRLKQQVYRFTYPNGMIYAGMDVTGASDLRLRQS
jgi:hypothetical protein